LSGLAIAFWNSGSVHQVQPLFETWIAAIAEVLMAEGMEENVAKQQAEKTVILVQGSLILAQGLNDVKFLNGLLMIFRKN
jgi:hypothetical protein